MAIDSRTLETNNNGELTIFDFDFNPESNDKFPPNSKGKNTTLHDGKTVRSIPETMKMPINYIEGEWPPREETKETQER